jgi:hypothetical protein
MTMQRCDEVAARLGEGCAARGFDLIITLPIGDLIMRCHMATGAEARSDQSLPEQVLVSRSGSSP